MNDSDSPKKPGSWNQKAVALTYDQESPPRLSASGRGHVAEQILQIAFENGVAVREDADLVEILSAVEVDHEIPLEAFAAVAEILTYLYELNATYGDAALSPGGETRYEEGL